MEKIFVKAMLLIQHGGRVLVWKGFDDVKNQQFYRLLGRHVEFSESAEAAIRREILEEIESEIEDLQLVTIVENIFTYLGKLCHEIDYLYKGRLKRTDLYALDQIPLHEDQEWLVADWVQTAEIINGQVPLYPPYNYSVLLAAGDK